MTWHETIEYIRTIPEYKDLVEKAYFEEDLSLNVDRFRRSEEFEETLKLLKKYQPNAKTILDIGCGNGISSIAFALQNYQVIAVEPDPSETIGAGAIRKLKQINQLQNIEIFEAFAEDIAFDTESFDVVYIRQAMHHAYDLNKFIGEAGRVLKKGGLLFTVRDHVIFDEKDKEWFLENHPLQKFYGGENAFKPEEYREAMQKAGLEVKQEIKYYDSVLNYFPSTKEELSEKVKLIEIQRKKSLQGKIKFLADVPLFFYFYTLYLNAKYGSPTDEKRVPGRMYSYIALKK